MKSIYSEHSLAKYKSGDVVIVPLIIKYIEIRDGDEIVYSLTSRYVQYSDVYIPEKEIIAKHKDK